MHGIYPQFLVFCSTFQGLFSHGHPMPQASQRWHPGLTCWWWWGGGCRLMLVGVGLFCWLVFFLVSDREVLPWDLTGCFQVYQVCVCVCFVCVCVSGHVCFFNQGVSNSIFMNGGDSWLVVGAQVQLGSVFIDWRLKSWRSKNDQSLHNYIRYLIWDTQKIGYVLCFHGADQKGDPAGSGIDSGTLRSFDLHRSGQHGRRWASMNQWTKIWITSEPMNQWSEMSMDFPDFPTMKAGS